VTAGAETLAPRFVLDHVTCRVLLV